VELESTDTSIYLRIIYREIWR